VVPQLGCLLHSQYFQLDQRCHGDLVTVRSAPGFSGPPASWLRGPHRP
jgi:hypothetical protein